MTDSTAVAAAYSADLAGEETHRGRGAREAPMADLLDARTIEANCALVRDELIERGMPALGADAWCAAWEAEAKRLGIDRRVADFWTIGSVWIRERTAMRQAG